MSEQLKMTKPELEAFLAQEFPQEFASETTQFSIRTLGWQVAEVGYLADTRNLRPGGTVSGPTLMMIADATMYILVLAHIGPVPLAVTTNLNINFMRRPSPGDLLARARLLKLGRALAVGDVTLYSAGDTQAPLAHATCTYALPSGK
ncbi:MAG: PaaI family thioesterase [Alphaproteobacteria bacterium]